MMRHRAAVHGTHQQKLAASVAPTAVGWCGQELATGLPGKLKSFMHAEGAVVMYLS